MDVSRNSQIPVNSRRRREEVQRTADLWGHLRGDSIRRRPKNKEEKVISHTKGLSPLHLKISRDEAGNISNATLNSTALLARPVYREREGGGDEWHRVDDT